MLSSTALVFLTKENMVSQTELLLVLGWTVWLL